MLWVLHGSHISHLEVLWVSFLVEARSSRSCPSSTVPARQIAPPFQGDGLRWPMFSQTFATETPSEHVDFISRSEHVESTLSEVRTIATRRPGEHESRSGEEPPEDVGSRRIAAHTASL